MRRTEEEQGLKLGINATKSATVDTTTDIFEPDDVPLQKVGVILRSQPEITLRASNETPKTNKHANKSATIAPPITPVKTVQMSTSVTNKAAVESNSTTITST